MPTRKSRSETAKKVEPKFVKTDILKSDEFTKIESDFLSAALSDGEYTIAEAKGILTKLRKGAVE